MRRLMRQAFWAPGLTLLCILALLCFGSDAGLTARQMADAGKPQHTGIAFDVVQGEQPADYAVRPNSQYPRPSSPLTLKQTHHFLAIGVSLILLVLIGCFPISPTATHRTCIFVTSWHLLRAPPKTV